MIDALSAGVFAVAVGLIGGLFALYAIVTSGWGIAVGLGIIGVIIAVLIASVRLAGRRRDDDYDYPGDDAEAHMGPLRQPGDAEKTLMLDLRQRRMLLPGTRGHRGRHAAQPAPLPVIPPSAEARTETIPVVPAEPAAHEATEVIPVLAGAVPGPVPLFAEKYPLSDTQVIKAFGSDDS